MSPVMAQRTGSCCQVHKRMRSPVASADAALTTICNATSFLRPPTVSFSQPRQSTPSAQLRGRYAAAPTCASRSGTVSRGRRALAVISPMVPALWSAAESVAISAEQASPSAANSLSEAATFEPQFNPGVLIVCLIAATPPILFWGRIFFADWKRKMEAKKEAEQQDLKQKDRDVRVDPMYPIHRSRISHPSIPSITCINLMYIALSSSAAGSPSSLWSVPNQYHMQRLTNAVVI